MRSHRLFHKEYAYDIETLLVSIFDADDVEQRLQAAHELGEQCLMGEEGRSSRSTQAFRIHWSATPRSKRCLRRSKRVTGW
jgi:hypothetical protein